MRMFEIEGHQDFHLTSQHRSMISLKRKSIFWPFSNEKIWILGSSRYQDV